MTKQLQLLIGFLFILSISFNGLKAQNAQQASATGHILAEVITAFSAVETSQMNFGRFSPGPLGGQLLISPQSTVSVTGSVVTGSGVPNAASFYITGDSHTVYSINLPNSSIALTNTTNARTMLVSNWVSVPAPGPGGAATLQEGYQTVYVGATLEVGTIHDNPVGVYTGSYIITFDFN